MIDRVIVQVPMSKQLKKQAEAMARDNGFSSLQETIRVFLKKFTKRELKLQIGALNEERLSPKAERRYAKMIDDIKHGRNITKTGSVEELLADLRS